MKQNGQYYSMNTVIKEKFPMPNFLSQNNHSIEIVSVFQNLMLHSVLEHAAIFPYCLTSLSYFINFHFQRFGKIEPKQKKSNKQSEIAFLSNIEIIDKQLMFFYEFDQKY